ncbi:MAG: 16S rRNA (uracil(1498)-N(3))-methyltransferase [Acidobacteriia bacterium]|nr:16S rRNA (uracil(1498)-N(3))-methyltransferase [Terriglobia bacterium]
MPRRRFFIPQNSIQDATAVLSPDQAHHLRDVLRLRPGEQVELFDGKGLGYSGTVEYHGTEIRIGSLKCIGPPEECGIPLVLAAALIKPDRFEWVLQKGTELGVDRFLPLETRFAAVHIPPAKLEARLERWRRIIREASKQSRRLTVPDIQVPLPLDALLALRVYATCARFMLHEKASERLKPCAPEGSAVLLCVGPEGGWDDAEAQAAERAGFRLVSLGSRILRAETAALAAVSVFQFLLQDTRSKGGAWEDMSRF